MKKALFVAGGWDGHEPQQCAELFASELQSRGFTTEIANTLDVYLDKEKLQELSLIVPIWTMGSITNEQEAGLIEAVASGVGLGGFHGGMGDAFRGNINYHLLTGGQFLAHPGNIKNYTVNITNTDHEITRGLNDFQMNSEQYYMLTDPGNKVLATTTFHNEEGEAAWSQGVVMPVAWTRGWGQGRIFFSSLGHVAKDFDVPEARELTIRGMLWASK